MKEEISSVTSSHRIPTSHHKAFCPIPSWVTAKGRAEKARLMFLQSTHIGEKDSNLFKFPTACVTGTLFIQLEMELRHKRNLFKSIVISLIEWKGEI